MSVARELLDRLVELGATVKPAGGHLILRAGARPIPAELVKSLREAKAEILTALAPDEPVQPDGGEDPDVSAGAARWCDRFAARNIHWFRACRSWHEAELLAYGDCIDEWRKRHVTRPDPRLCASCGDELGANQGLSLCDNARVHFDDKYGAQCLNSYGRKWRCALKARIISGGGFHPDNCR
jgi:hypothetical protein